MSKNLYMLQTSFPSIQLQKIGLNRKAPNRFEHENSNKDNSNQEKYISKYEITYVLVIKDDLVSRFVNKSTSSEQKRARIVKRK